MFGEGAIDQGELAGRGCCTQRVDRVGDFGSVAVDDAQIRVAAIGVRRDRVGDRNAHVAFARSGSDGDRRDGRPRGPGRAGVDAHASRSGVPRRMVARVYQAEAATITMAKPTKDPTRYAALSVARSTRNTLHKVSAKSTRPCQRCTAEPPRRPKANSTAAYSVHKSDSASWAWFGTPRFQCGPPIVSSSSRESAVSTIALSATAATVSNKRRSPSLIANDADSLRATISAPIQIANAYASGLRKAGAGRSTSACTNSTRPVNPKSTAPASAIQRSPPRRPSTTSTPASSENASSSEA